MTTPHELLQGTVAQDRSVMSAIRARVRYISRGKRFLLGHFLRYVIGDHRGETSQLINLANVRLLYCYHALKKRGLFENVEIKMSGLEPEDMMKPIRKYFTVEQAPRQPTKWLITCEKCDSMWHLDKANKHPGNVLHLLNHARGHDEPKPRGKRKQAALDALNG